MKIKRFLSFGVKYTLTAFIIVSMIFGSFASFSATVARAGGSDDASHGVDHGTELATGSIRVCKIIIDGAGQMVDGATQPGVVMTIPGQISTSDLYGPAASVLPDTIITTPMTLNTRLMDSSAQNDAYCDTYSNLPIGHYYYAQESMADGGDASAPVDGWREPTYHDDVGEYLNTLEWFRPYSGELFDDIDGNECCRNANSDGHIFLDPQNPDATLVVVNRMIAVVDDGNGTGGCETDCDNGTGGGSTGGGSTGGGTSSGGAGVTSSGTGSGSTGGSGSPAGTIGGGVSTSAPQGEVLGVSTCTLYLKSYLRRGYKNDPEEVKKLQTFLGSYLGVSIPVTGKFDQRTEAAVGIFQRREHIKVLDPWNITDSTGIVYLTTKAQINNLVCPGLNLPIPSPLINWSQNPETASIPHEQVAGVSVSNDK